MRLDGLALLQWLAIAYLLFKVYHLEKLVRGGSPRGPRPLGDAMPLLKENIEPGPFAKGNRQHEKE